MRRTVCLAILNYNGREHLCHLLPTALHAARTSAHVCHVLVLDNRSSTDDVAWLRDAFPTVTAIVAPKNDFLYSYNHLLPGLQSDIVILLNNDLRVAADFIDPLVRHFVDSNVFSVSCRSYDWSGEQVTSGPARLTCRNGWYSWYYDVGVQQLAHTLFTSGGFMAVDRAKFVGLGGFNRLFMPAYCEDVDLGFRAWRRGWRCIYEPSSVVWHRENASWAASDEYNVSELVLANALLFQWSTLPMKHRWRRMLSLAKLLVSHPSWSTTFPKAVFKWLRVRRHYRWMKTSDDELDRVVENTERECRAP